MRIKISQLRALIRESIEETLKHDSAEIEESEFIWKIAKAAKDGKKKVKVGDEEFPVKMTKKKADIILDEESVEEGTT